MMSVNVSVVTATYNPDPKFLRECIQSVRDQDVNHEHIIVDDGSENSHTDALVDSFNDARIKYFFRHHEGHAAALNSAIRLSEGEFVAVLDHDDLLLPFSLRKRVQFLEENPQYLAVVGGCHYVDANGRQYKTKCPSVQRSREKMSKDALREVLNSVFHPTMMYRRETFQKVGYYDTRLKVAFDKDMLLRIIRISPIGELSEPIVSYRTHNGNASSVYRDEIPRDWGFICDRNLPPGIYREYLKLKKTLVTKAKKIYQTITPNRI